MGLIATSSALVIVTLALIGYPSRHVASAPTRTAVNTPETPSASVHDVQAQPVPMQAALLGTDPVEPAVPVPSSTAVVEKPLLTKVGKATTLSPADPVPLPPATFGAVSETSEPAAAVPPVSPVQPSGLTSVQAHDASQATTTITGCLESTVDEERFRLTDTDGADAPKARGWRSGFLRKRPAPVELIEPPDVLALRKYVGHRVVATGLLTNRELRVRSLEPAGSPCQ